MQKDYMLEANPVFKKRIGFKDHGWGSVEGYWNEADKTARCLMANRRFGDYTAFVSLNIEVVLNKKQVTGLWSKITRNLRKNNVIAFWVREGSKKGHVNYHLIVKSHHYDLAAVIRASVEPVLAPWKKGNRNPFHFQVQDWEGRKQGRKKDRNAYLTCRYVVKAKTAKYVGGKLVSKDRWAKKRTFFRTGLRLQKCGAVGDFWGLSKAKLWKEIIEKERRIADGVKIPGAEDYARHLHNITEGFVPLKLVRRAVGYHADQLEADGAFDPPEEAVVEAAVEAPKERFPIAPTLATPSRGRVFFQRFGFRHPRGPPRNISKKIVN